MTEPILAEVRKADEEYASTMRVMVRHENDVSNHRTTWLMVTQGILFTAVSAVIKEVPWAAAAIAVIGILITISIGHSLKNSYESRKYLKDLWRRRVEDREYKSDEILPLDGGYPGNNAITWLLPGNFIPKVVIAAWFLLLVYLVCQWTRQNTN